MTIRYLAATLVAALGFALLQASAEEKRAEKAFDDAMFVRMAASGGMTEVMLGKIGEEQAKSADVKKFAGQIVADHSKANTELKAIAEAAKIQVDEALMKEHQKHVDMFKDYKGSDFDKDYIDHMIKDHEEDVALFTRASNEAKNEQLKDFAKRTLPTLESHLKMAKSLQGK